MKRKLPLVFGALFLVFAATACEGPAGPAGEQGATGETGATGPQGPAGTDGTNALNTCSDCHTSDATIVAIEQQFETTKHAEAYLRTGSCAGCHTSQGFVADVTGGTADFTNGAARINCRTCHQIHTTYEGADFALTTTDPVTLTITGNEFDATGTDVPGSNLCVNCHQGRPEDVYPSYDESVDSLFEVTSSHYDFHHGPQSNMFAAEFPTETMYGETVGSTYSFHAAASCLGCHMGLGTEVGDVGLDGVSPGGTLFHNFTPDDGICEDCHSDSEGFDHNGVRTAVDSTVVLLGACLEAEGVVEVDPADGHAFHVVLDDTATAGTNEGMHPQPYVAAYIMLQAVVEDGSWGAHNPPFITSLLDEIGMNLDTNSADAACTYTSLF